MAQLYFYQLLRDEWTRETDLDVDPTMDGLFHTLAAIMADEHRQTDQFPADTLIGLARTLTTLAQKAG